MTDNRFSRRRAFINFITGRSGSSLLTSYINQFPDLICYGEILFGLSGREQAALLERLSEGDRLERHYPAAADPTYFIIPPWRKHQDDIAAIGLKVKYGDLEDLEVMLGFLRDNQFQVMYTTRNNLVRVVLSRLRARDLYNQTGGYTNMVPSTKFRKLSINLKQFEELLVQERRYYDDLNDLVVRSGCPVAGVEYELLRVDPVATLNTVAEFLGSSYRVKDRDPGFTLTICPQQTDTCAVPLVTTMFQVTQHDMRSTIENYDEFQSYFSNTPYAANLS